MQNVVTTDVMRAFDRHMIEQIGIDGVILMENAAIAVADTVIRHADGGLCAILIGPGNNGGDGLALLRILASRGVGAVGVLLCNPDAFSGDALKNYTVAKNLKLNMCTELSVIATAGVIVDAVFGTGLKRAITGIQKEAIQTANQTDAYRIAVDIPSGMSGDTGDTQGMVFRADETVTFQCIKRGLLLTGDREAVGKLNVAPIGTVPGEMSAILEREQLIDFEYVDSILPKRKTVSNKGSYGHGLIVAGSTGMQGAAVMSALAALRGGAGLTKALVPKEIIGAFASVPEVMPIPFAGAIGNLDGNVNGEGESANIDGNPANSIHELIGWATAIGIGCGMANDPMLNYKLKQVLSSHKPTVIDADGLNEMSRENAASVVAEHCKTRQDGQSSLQIDANFVDIMRRAGDNMTISAESRPCRGCEHGLDSRVADGLLGMLHENCVITPHPAEMARLIGVGVKDILSDPVAYAADFAKEHGCAVLLKSATTVIASSDGRIRYNTAGNTGLAKGGSGDVLTGIITAMLAQGLSPFDAASAGAFLLGSSADSALELLKTRALTATDVISALQRVCD